MSAPLGLVASPDLSRYRFWPRLGVFVVACLVFFLVPVPGVLFVPKEMQAYLIIALTSGVSGLVLLALFVSQYRSYSGARLRGEHISTPLKAGALRVIAAYALCGIAIAVLGLPREVFMVELLANLTTWQTLIKIASIIVFAPLAEELFVRHYMLRLFPYENSRTWQVVAIIVTSTVFAALHFQYGNITTLALIFAVGCVFAIARIASGGLLVPLLLHALAEVVALTMDWTYSVAGLYG
nr:type II CAAX endopeptidase family protein [Pseudomonas gingeri]